MYNTILVPVDMSEDGFSDQAIEHAKKLLQKGGSLHFLRVVPGYQMPWVGSFFPEDAFGKAIKQSQQHLDSYIQNQLKDADLNYRAYVMEGRPAELIVKTADKIRADLIVMASHKHSKVEKKVLGSIAAKVVGHAHMPVLVVKKQG